MRVVEHSRVLPYLQARGLTEQYRKARSLLEQGLFPSVQLRKRQPKSSGIWYFRITQKYRALCIWEGDTLIVFDVDDHQ